MPRGNVSKRQLKAIMAKLKSQKHVGFDNMKIYLINQRNPHTGSYYTEEQATKIAGSIFQHQRHAGFKKEKK